MPCQRRLAISRLPVPNLDGLVPAAAGNLLSIGTPRHWHDPEIERSQETNQQKQRGENLRGKKLGKKNVPPARVPGHRRLAISRLRVPNLDGAVDTAAGNLLSIGTPRHRSDTVFVRSQYTNQQKPVEKLGGKTYSPECPVTGHSYTYILKSCTFILFSSTYLWTKSYLSER